MSTLKALIHRNVKLFFKDKGMFFTSLITPAILLVLYVSFLGNVYRDSFVSNLPTGLSIDDALIDALVGTQLISSILAVSCVTVSFCSNFLMVQDKANGTIKDLKIAPVRSSLLSISYYIATLASTLIICYIALALCLLYLSVVGWFLSLTDVLLLIVDVFLLVMFGTALSSVINFFLSTQGQISAVGSIVSAGYGFICGAYMPISSFSEGLQRMISFLPGTYATSLFRNHALNGVLESIKNDRAPMPIPVDGFKDMLDCNIYFFDNQVSIGAMYIVLICSVALLVGAYVLINALKKEK